MRWPVCAAVSYHVSTNECVLSNSPCPVAAEAPGWRVRMIQAQAPDACVQWVDSASVDIDSDRVVRYMLPQDDLVMVVVRTSAGGALFPTKWHATDFVAYCNAADQLITTTPSTLEVLLISPHCMAAWMPYDVSGNDIMPSGAISGGQMPDGSEVYVVRAVVPVSNGQKLVGYYKPSLRTAVIPALECDPASQMDILTIL